MTIKSNPDWNDIVGLLKEYADPDSRVSWDEMLDTIKVYHKTALTEAIQAEREVYAVIAEQEYTKHGISPDASFGSEGYGWNRAAVAIAAAIRARQ